MTKESIEASFAADFDAHRRSMQNIEQIEVKAKGEEMAIPGPAFQWQWIDIPKIPDHEYRRHGIVPPLSPQANLSFKEI